MNHEKLIELISKGETVSSSEELYKWVSHSAGNEKEYIRYKNLYALLQRGNDMDSATVEHEYHKLEKKIQGAGKKIFLRNLVRYAAIALIALSAGFFINQINFYTEIAYNELIVPKGNRMSISLPDGTHVWLSNGTKLKYPESFKGKTREVELEGEGFFEVQHDKKHPFIVNLGQHRIKVLGTKFAVVAYPNDKTINAELLSGKIQFDVYKGENRYNLYELQPRESLVFDKSTGKLYKSQIEDGYFEYWELGRYRFKDEPFSSLAQKINRIYNVEIVFQAEDLKDILFTGSFHIDDNIYTLMEVFKKASGKPFEYEQKKGTIYVRDK